jgi:pyruvate dehydrogenase E2 component (dihydrolipoamide acetyltransferase)
MAEIVMPRLVEHMEEALVAQWLYAEGDEVSVGDEIVEIETDKAITALESEFSGTLRIVADAGTMVAVGAPLAEVGAASAAPAPQDVSTDGDAASTSPPAAVSNDAPAAPATAPAAAGAATSTSVDERPGSGSGNGSGRLLASPVARRIASEHGLDLASLAPSRPSGRILKVDVLRAVEAGSQPAAAGAATLAPAPAAAGDGFGTATLQELSRTQQLIARRMTESTATVPDFATAMQVEMTACRELRQQLQDSLGESQPAPSYNDMVVKAVAVALRDFPRVNGSYRDGKFELHSRVNVGVAVAADDTLVVPTVFDADRATLGSIARTTRELAGKVRDGSVSPPELAGGTFTVSNLGMFGISHFTAVINQPQAAILAVGGIEERAVVRDGQVCARAMMTINLVSDHRILYGADAAKFVARVRELLEKPLAILI